MIKIDYSKNYTIPEIKELCKEYHTTIEEFSSWFAGKTGIMDDEGNRLVFGDDVEKFFRRFK